MLLQSIEVLRLRLLPTDPAELPNQRGPDLKSGDLATDPTKSSVCYATRIKTPKASGFFVQVRTLVQRPNCT